MFKTFEDAIDARDADVFRPEVLKYGWPGAITQTVEHGFGGERVVDPDGVEWRLGPFSENESFCAGDEAPVQPRVLKAPLGSGEAGRVPLRATADATLAIQSYYSFFGYSDAPTLAADSAPADAGWAAGLPGNECASIIWMGARASAGVELEGAFEDQEAASSGL